MNDFKRFIPSRGLKITGQQIMFRKMRRPYLCLNVRFEPNYIWIFYVFLLLMNLLNWSKYLADGNLAVIDVRCSPGKVEHNIQLFEESVRTLSLHPVDDNLFVACNRYGYLKLDMADVKFLDQQTCWIWFYFLFFSIQRNGYVRPS